CSGPEIRPPSRCPSHDRAREGRQASVAEWSQARRRPLTDSDSSTRPLKYIDHDRPASYIQQPNTSPRLSPKRDSEKRHSERDNKPHTICSQHHRHRLSQLVDQFQGSGQWHGDMADIVHQRGHDTDVDPSADSHGALTAAGLSGGSCGTELPPNSKFCNECGAAVSGAAKTAEYKQVTVLFADVVHSMDIAAAVGAERLREIMADLADRCAAVVHRYEGTVDKFTGDG